jgi:hypothetical protein
MKIASHPTNYKGVQFRSRLEASWAAFFDICGWRWQYEPIDLDGWVPDFVIPGSGSRRILVEVKPIFWPSNVDQIIDLVEADPQLEKARRHAAEVLILGVGPVELDAFSAGLGAFVNEFWSGTGGVSGGDAALLCVSKEDQLDVCAYYGSYHYRLSGEHDGDHHIKPLQQATVNNMWNHARNLTQWRGAMSVTK